MGACFSVSLSLDNFINRCWDCVAGQAAYVCQLQDSLKALQKARQELVAQKTDLMSEVIIQESPEMERTAIVEDWFQRVDALITEVDGVFDVAPQEINKLCLGGCCSKNYKSSYVFAKKVAEKLVEVEVIKTKGVFSEVVKNAVPKPVVQRNVASTVGMESVLDESWNKIMQDGVDTIGIYGMGGVGKTTLLKHINNKLKGVIPTDFDVVIFITVSKDYKKEKVQEGIWKCLGFDVETWKTKSHEEKVQDIFNLLQKKKFVVMLDDIWESINLADDIGVPNTRQI